MSDQAKQPGRRPSSADDPISAEGMSADQGFSDRVIAGPELPGNERMDLSAVPEGTYEVMFNRIDPATGKIADPPATTKRLIDPRSPAIDSETPTSNRAEANPNSLPIESPSPAVASSRKPAGSKVRLDSWLQSIGLLMAMVVMSLVARYMVPPIVEEIRFAWHRGELRAEYEAGTNGLRNVSLESLSDAYEMVTAAVGPTVVHIDVERLNSSALPDAFSNRMVPSADQGSGVVVDSSGYIITNRHVITDRDDASGTTIRVTLSDGRRLPATIVGTDALTDLAVLKVNANQLMAIRWGDSDRCRVGSPVWAVGSPFGLDRTVTFGILSGKHRKVRASTEWQDFMQSDVAVNPGNSGGPLVDARGTLIGINTAIVGDTYQGVSFSVPSNVVHQVYDRLVRDGKVERGWLGVSLANVSDEQLVGSDRRTRGALVQFLTDQTSPAARAGIKVGDIVVQVDEVPVRDTHHLMQLIGQAGPGEEILLQVAREGEMKDFPIILDTRPAAMNPR